jgi:sigma-B regulation protein RsbU (phosphoserine phosphatase)
MIQPKSLQQRLSLFLFLPVTLLLFGMGIVGFIYARNSLLDQWREAAILKMQRAAHNADMRLGRIKERLRLFHETAGSRYPEVINLWLVEQLQALEGVARVNLTWENEESGNQTNFTPLRSMGRMGRGSQMMRDGRKMRMRPFHRTRIREITPPRYDSLIEHKTVSLLSDLNDENGQTVGRLEVLINFDYLIENVVASGWWQSQKAFLVDHTGKILTSTVPEEREKLGDNNDPVEQKTLHAMDSMPYGTIRGHGHPPHEVSGFYKLQEAPWSLVIIAPGRVILSSIIRFRLYYFLTVAGFILFILLLIRFVTGRTVSSIKDVSRAAERVARGDFGNPLSVKTQDEVGELTRSFNTMVLQLEERIRLKAAMDLAMEVQQKLLPQQNPKIDGMDIAAKSIYCDETGGDYYDFIQFPELGKGGIGIVVGDVVGHGIAAALLMTTARALLRSRVSQPGSLAQKINDVNRLLCNDTSQDGSFMTLFFMLIDIGTKEIRWVRAGHDPAIVYDASTDSFDELSGEGIVLGADDKWSFQDNKYSRWSDGQIILIGTDGIWETVNPDFEQFGKERVRQIIHQHSNSSAQELLQTITDELDAFRQSAKQVDDITLVIIKITR